jgi:hypothetical protein
MSGLPACSLLASANRPAGIWPPVRIAGTTGRVPPGDPPPPGRNSCRANKGLFDLGDIAALVDRSVVRWERTDAPAVLQDLRYDFTQNNGEILRIYHVESEPTFQLLENVLRRIANCVNLPN